MSNAKKIFALLILFIISGNSLYSQTLERSAVVHTSFHDAQKAQISEGTLHIIAAMVDFQPDTNRFTSGNGTFDDRAIPYLHNDQITIDPLPHNRSYFEAHLEFAKNYFSKMSGGALIIDYHVLEPVFRLPNEMKHYSPTGVDPSPEPLAKFARDAWMKVADNGDLNLNIGPSDQVAFVLFHSGVGRDIELTGTILEKTPQDIPSVYLSKDAFSRLFDDPAFSGFPIDEGNLLVDNTLILPRTLTRAGEDVTGSEVLLQLSINGMVTAQIGSHIGLPDLFNTNTGASGIGRFGLMDGAGIFAYNGLFPPELSAWEKVHMGWAEPFYIDYDFDGEIDLPAASLRHPNSIAKVSISGSEYFLIENRHREAGQNGTTITIQRPDGSRDTQIFTNADTSFVFQLSDFSEQFEIPGVVVDVSNYDFALPGGPADLLDETDDNEGRILNGGILIWQIDESIIESRLVSRQGINDDPTRRGVHLVEADGAQDIGRPTAIGFFQNEVNGSAFDFWWDGNDASVITQTGTITLYENRFGPDTTPNNDSHSGAKSAFELFDFSENLPIASFKIRNTDTGGDLYEVVEFSQNLPFIFSTPEDDLYWSQYPLSSFSFGNEQGSESIIPARDGVLYRHANGDLTSASSEASFQQPLINFDTGILALAPNPDIYTQNFTVTLLEQTTTGFAEFWEFETEANNGLISSPAADIIQFDGTVSRARSNSNPPTIEENFYSSPGHYSEQINGFESFISNSGEIIIVTPSYTSTSQITIPDQPYVRKHIGLIEQEDGEFQTFLFFQNELYLFTNSPDGIDRSTIHQSEHLDWPALADINKSGTIDFLFIDRSENKLIAKNINGAVLPGFPIKPPPGVQFNGTPIIADLNGNNEFEIIMTGKNQQSINLYGFDSSGRPIEGFPLLIGGVSVLDDDPVHPSLGGQYLTAISPIGDLRVWRFPNMRTVLWSSRYGNHGTNKLTGRQLTEPVATQDFGILNTTETYNWPNPASDETFIRYQTVSPGEVQIKIATTSGRLIYDRTVQSYGRGPEEISIDTSRWGSGGYIAVIKATVDGQSERKLVKIAIAK